MAPAITTATPPMKIIQARRPTNRPHAYMAFSRDFELLSFTALTVKGVNWACQEPASGPAALERKDRDVHSGDPHAAGATTPSDLRRDRRGVAPTAALLRRRAVAASRGGGDG